MEEAERLCDRIGIMEKGKVLAIGPTYELIKKVKFPYNVELVIKKDTEKNIFLFRKYGEIINTHQKEHFYEIRVKDQNKLDEIIKIIQKIKPEDFQIRKASLEDLFIELTGKRMGE